MTGDLKCDLTSSEISRKIIFLFRNWNKYNGNECSDYKSLSPFESVVQHAVN